MKNRTVARLLYAHPVDMGGLPVRQPLPTGQVEQIDPFLLLHHADVKVPAHVNPDHAGVGPHPHRGFSPVTFIFKGGVHHRDSRGNDSVIYAGGAQCVIHSERPPDDIQEIGGRQEIIQLWINTPSDHKMDQPAYYPVEASTVPTVMLDENKVEVKVFAGELAGLRGPIPTTSDVVASTLTFEKGGKISLDLPENHNAFLYLLDGKITLDGFGLIEGHHLIHLNMDGEGFSAEALESTRALLATGVPLDEEVVSYGPFVMNSQTEILEAMRDYRVGKMGVLIEE